MKLHMRFGRIGLSLIGILGVVLLASCSKGPTPPVPPGPKDPQTELTFAPIEFDTTGFRVHFFWNGYDDDGEVMRFYYAVDQDTTKPINEWNTTTSKDTTLLFLVDPVSEIKIHVFKVAAQDDQGNFDKTPASRAFSAKTIPPTSKIEKGPTAFNPTIGPNFTFEWSGIDPDGGETGGKAPADTFQYLLLRLGTTAGDPTTHDALPQFNTDLYVKMIRDAVGDGLLNYGAPQRWDDWKWQGVRGLKLRFRNVTPGEYVFAERAVDIAGATEKDLIFVRNIRHFTVTGFNPGPRLTVRSNILNRPLPSASGPDDFARRELQIFEGETVSFSWSADASDYGGEIVGYTYALDDTSSFPGLDLRVTGATFLPSRLEVPPGADSELHFLYVRAVDDGGLITNMKIPLRIVHPRFKDPGSAHTVLFVDDSFIGALGNGSAPTEGTEDDWWQTRGPLNDGLPDNIPYSVWDTTDEGVGDVEGRKQPPAIRGTAEGLTFFTTVVWATDFQNSGSIQTALFKTVAGGDYSELQGYLRAGGTLILTGWHLALDTTGGPNRNLTVRGGVAAPNGICAAFAVGSDEYNATIFPRSFLGIDNSVQNQDGRRLLGASDFVAGVPTPAAAAMGFTSAEVDTGNESVGVQYPDNSGSGQPTYKWNTNSVPFIEDYNQRDQQMFPGLPGVEGWVMARNFMCIAIQNIGMENPGLPIVQPLYTYHGVRKGTETDTGGVSEGGPSPREGLVIGAFYQSHDLGQNAGTYDPKSAIGRMAVYTFPLYYIKDAQAVNIMSKSFAWVDGSPTLP